MVYRPRDLISKQAHKLMTESFKRHGAEKCNIRGCKVIRRARPDQVECEGQETGSFLVEAYTSLLNICKRTDAMLNLQEIDEISDEYYSSDDTTSDDVASRPSRRLTNSAANVLAEFVGSRVENVCTRMQDVLRMKSASSSEAEQNPCGHGSVFMPFIGSTVNGKFRPGFETFDPSNPVLPPPRGLFSTAVIYARKADV
uniref:Uncharacterized protein n=1 Tax=Hanusia phi TaxID=3032 RepID=A0A7S0HP83_9CRYP|mmetsp:Transcript_34221/g.77058  ORF Transcript_34221/g.77058 Transcript_34221/m.77058 type:complete len:199 (+) Transcript_34221:393-989(+)|eukprot:130714-Hanusia_phi.AAC.5